MLRLATWALRVVLLVVLGVAVLWSVAALWIDGPANRVLAGLLAAIAAVVALGLLILVRPWPRGYAAALLPVAVVAAWWLSLQPSNERDWLPEVARLPSAEVRGDQLTIHNLRNFAYPSPTSTIERWETRTYDLSRLEGFDLFLSYWGPTLYAHTIASWVFAEGPPLAISIETRKERGEEYSALLGFFRQFELYYVVADERDVIGVRAGPRQEQIYLYRLRGSPALARALLARYIAEINRLASRPQWYHAIVHNCTTEIRHRAREVTPNNPFDWRLLANGYLDELGYERGMINTSLPFPELRRRSEITSRARAATTDPTFSRLIREGLPERPAPR
jgi:uncharacterized protein DUF4105